MTNEKNISCTYCARREPKSIMTPMYEENKDGWVRYYCPRCIEDVKTETYKRPSHHLYKFGKPGE